LLAIAIHGDVVQVLGHEAARYSTVTKYLRRPTLRGQNSKEETHVQEAAVGKVDEATLKAPADDLFL
jgi:hypothetical protein